MQIQSLSICVPGAKCINNCAFCVSRMRKDEYPNNIMGNVPMKDLYIKDYIKRMEYAKDCGCNTVMLTGQVEPQQNKHFLELFATMNRQMPSPFKSIEIQTTGAGLDDDYLMFLRNYVGVTTVSLSVSSLYSDDVNNEVIGTRTPIRLKELCRSIKKYGFNLRLSLNVTKKLVGNDHPDVNGIINVCAGLGADQVTFRKMYVSGQDTPQNRWIRENSLVDEGFWYKELEDYIVKNGKYIDTLEYGAKRYSVKEMSVVVDDDCMSKDETRQAIKYFILRPNCKLYTKWDDKGSLIF